jgi:hypothetical protein
MIPSQDSSGYIMEVNQRSAIPLVEGPHDSPRRLLQIDSHPRAIACLFKTEG